MDTEGKLWQVKMYPIIPQGLDCMKGLYLKLGKRKIHNSRMQLDFSSVYMNDTPLQD